MAEKKTEKQATNQKAGPFPSPTPEEKLVKETDRLKGERIQKERMEKDTAQEGDTRSETQAPAREEAPAKAAENTRQEAGEPVPPAGSHTITLEGEGTTPIIGADGKVRTVERGVEIEVSDEEITYLKTADLKFSKGKKK